MHPKTLFFLKYYMRLGFLSAVILLPSLSRGQFGLSLSELPPFSPINNVAITLPDSSLSYNFMTTGHLFGSHENRNSIYPAASFLSNIDMINSHTPTVFITIGDIIRSATDSLAIQAWQITGRKLNVPVYNAPGNHDLDDGVVAYGKAFGRDQSSFFIRNDFFLLLNTEYLLEGKTAKIKSFIDLETKKATKRAKPVRHLFVFSHRMLAPLCSNDLASLDAYSNDPISDKVNKEDACEIFEKLLEIPRTGEYWHFSGDVGTHWSVPALYGFDVQHHCHLLATGVGDAPEDRIAKVSVSPEGKVTAEVLSLSPTGMTQPATDFTATFWEKNKKQKQLDRVTSKNGILAQFRKVSFWGGVGTGVLLSLLGLFLFRGFFKNVRLTLNWKKEK